MLSVVPEMTLKIIHATEIKADDGGAVTLLDEEFAARLGECLDDPKLGLRHLESST